MNQIYKDASSLYEVEERKSHAERDGFRINELKISTSQQVPWHYHSVIKDTFYVLEGEITINLRDPEETVRIGQSETYEVPAKRPHLVTNTSSCSARFLILQGIGEYDYIPLT